jgi:hypothetical protein
MSKIPIPVKTRLSHLGINAKIYLSLFVLGIGFILVALLAWKDAGDQTSLRAEHEIDIALQVSETDLKEELNDLLVLGNWLAGQEGVGAMIRARDQVGLARFLEPLTKATIVGSVMVADNKGTVLARLSQDQPVGAGENILNLPGVSEGLSGQEMSGILRSSPSNLQSYFIVPVYDASQKPPVGILMTTFALDGSLASRLARTVG